MMGRPDKKRINDLKYRNNEVWLGEGTKILKKQRRPMRAIVFIENGKYLINGVPEG